MDGNGRWAVAKGLPRIEGHKRGIEAVRGVVAKAPDLGIRWLTLYSFSTENWKRPSGEVKFLFTLMEQNLRSEAAHLHAKKVRVRFLGSREGVPAGFLKTADAVARRTAENEGLTLVLAVNYGGRREILDAARKMAAAAPAGEVRFEDFMYMPDLPDADLIVRTAGEQRISNFLLWQSAYAEFHATRVLWPDFDGACLEKACAEYRRRKRKFGGPG